MRDEREQVKGYLFTEWDCPDCSEVNRREGDASGEDKCERCGAEVEVG